jgi:hypothetical protein
MGEDVNFEAGVDMKVDSLTTTVGDVTSARDVKAARDVTAAQDVKATRDVTAAQDAKATRDVTAGRDVVTVRNLKGNLLLLKWYYFNEIPALPDGATVLIYDAIIDSGGRVYAGSGDTKVLASLYGQQWFAIGWGI